jgi:hypothetical protein
VAEVGEQDASFELDDQPGFELPSDDVIATRSLGKGDEM